MSLRNSWGSRTTPLGLRVGAIAVVLAAHVVLGAVLLKAAPDTMLPEEPQTVQIRFVEIAPEVQQAAAPEETPTPVEEPAPPEPVVEPPPPEPEPPPPPPEPEPEPPPPEPEPEPEPPPPPPPPEPPPKPKPEPPPKPKPPPKPRPKPTPPKEVTPPVSRPPPVAAPTGSPEAPAQRNAAPDQPTSPRPDTPKLIGTVDYVGQRPTPNYPRASQRLREEGRVVIRVTIDVQGHVQRAVVQRSSGFDRLDEEALKAARIARFRPYTENGVPYPAMADLPFDFKLR